MAVSSRSLRCAARAALLAGVLGLPALAFAEERAGVLLEDVPEAFEAPDVASVFTQAGYALVPNDEVIAATMFVERAADTPWSKESLAQLKQTSGLDLVIVVELLQTEADNWAVRATALHGVEQDSSVAMAATDELSDALQRLVSEHVASIAPAQADASHSTPAIDSSASTAASASTDVSASTDTSASTDVSTATDSSTATNSSVATDSTVTDSSDAPDDGGAGSVDSTDAASGPAGEIDRSAPDRPVKYHMHVLLGEGFNRFGSAGVGAGGRFPIADDLRVVVEGGFRYVFAEPSFKVSEFFVPVLLSYEVGSETVRVGFQGGWAVGLTITQYDAGSDSDTDRTTGAAAGQLMVGAQAFIGPLTISLREQFAKGDANLIGTVGLAF